MDTKGDRRIRHEVAYNKSHEKWAGERPEDSSRRREYRWRKKTWKTRSRERGPK